ncbi:Pr6Pr family membrane protein [Yimella sp. cx-51]|uniref:Pr6Pr family membrane protein n=1 Tax=Yimella sp. cx-51 TaxID=2770551 RepID=UPI00165E7C3F|nr:Pr6Pr family membrane protein [Yimella sp. cx-51]MBC9956598.1 Pr6Pr family membrane protein [Yimella sp. cx-51]QTH38303.1 Pr6Pr family membrane protein [Yimella sp. cx-51]
MADIRARRAHLLTAVVAWVGVVLVAVLSATGSFAPPKDIVGHLFGVHPSGFAGAMSRLVDTLSYFTVWSNIVVAIAFTLLARRPNANSLVQRVLLLDALLMITITTVVYWALLAAKDTWSGWSVITSPLQHLMVGMLAIGSWAIYGPRGWLRFNLLPYALIIPMVWIVWTLSRGMVIDAYPYDFTDVATLGYVGVAIRLVVILAIGMAIAALYCAIDRRRARSNDSP